MGRVFLFPSRQWRFIYSLIDQRGDSSGGHRKQGTTWGRGHLVSVVGLYRGEISYHHVPIKNQGTWNHREGLKGQSSNLEGCVGVNKGVCRINRLQSSEGWIWPGLWVLAPGRVGRHTLYLAHRCVCRTCVHSRVALG